MHLFAVGLVTVQGKVSSSNFSLVFMIEVCALVLQQQLQSIKIGRSAGTPVRRLDVHVEFLGSARTHASLAHMH